MNPTASQEFPTVRLSTKTTTSTTQVVSAQPRMPRHHLVLTGYYLLLLAITLAGVGYGYVFSEIFFPSHKPHLIELALNILKLSWLIPLPYAVMNFYSFVRYPVFKRSIPPPISQSLGIKLYFRFVTRGQNPRLIAQTARQAYEVLSRSLSSEQWTIEVVSETSLPLYTPDGKINVIIIPPDYQTESGAKYKARALEYARLTSPAESEDWIIHLDEETGFDGDTARAIHRFVRKQQPQVAFKRQQYPKIGQGVILYGKGEIVNWITTLADSIRVGDDYGRFRLQFENRKAYFGLHGSFIVIKNAVEQMIGFDHGPKCSITEDCYFALAAQAQGIEYEFIHAFMYEKSPFSVRDFTRQRRRWFGGLWLVVLSPKLPLKERLVLGTFMLLWSLSWLCIVMVYINFLYPTGTPAWLPMMGGVSFLYYVSLYIIGFLRTFDYKDGWIRLGGLLVLQIILIPLFSTMEAAGVIYGLISPPRDFFIVQKEI